MYHFFSAVGGAMLPVMPGDELRDAGCCAGSSAASPASESLGSVPLSINALRDAGPDEVEREQDQRREDRHEDHRERGATGFLRRRPGDLLELRGDLVREVIDAIVAIRDDADDGSTDRGGEADLEIAGRRRSKRAPHPVEAPLQ